MQRVRNGIANARPSLQRGSHNSLGARQPKPEEEAYTILRGPMIDNVGRKGLVGEGRGHDRLAGTSERKPRMIGELRGSTYRMRRLVVVH